MEPVRASWRDFLRRHKGAVVIFAIAAVLIFAWAVYVFWWFVGNAQSSGLVPPSLGLWTMGNLLSFVLYSIFWELLLVGIPVVVGATAGWMWWKRLPSEERMAYHFGRRSRSASGSGGVSFLFFVAFCIKVYLDGNWNTAISTFTLNYVVSSMITILVYMLIIIGIPVAIALTWWIRRELKKP
jgi:uncharacterized MAPEG superfamily protein